MSKIEGRITPAGEIGCPACGCKGVETVPGGIEIRCQRCKLEYRIEAEIWEARTDFAIVEKFGQMIAAFQNFIDHRETRIGKRLVMT